MRDRVLMNRGGDMQIKQKFRARRTITGVVALFITAALALPSAASLPPSPPEAPTAEPGHRQVRLSWVIPADPDIAAIVVRRSPSAPPATTTDGRRVFVGLDTHVLDTGLTNGQRYFYRLWSRADDGSLSTPVDVSATPVERKPSRLTMHVDDRRLEFGKRVHIRGLLTRAGSDRALRDEKVQLQTRGLRSHKWSVVSSRISGRAGRVQWLLRPDRSADYRLVHEATSRVDRSTSRALTVRMRPRLDAKLGRHWVLKSGTAHVQGKVLPTFRDDHILLQRRVDGRWRVVDRERQGRDSRFRFKVDGWTSVGPVRYRVVVPSTTRHDQVTTSAMTLKVMRQVTYQIETRGRIVASMDTFRDRVSEIYADRRGWSRAYVHFRRIKSGADFSVVLAQAERVDDFAPVCDTYYSCRVGRYVIINQDRWRFGTPTFLRTGASLAQYRAMVINHETGHWFGLGHRTCPKQGAPAPVMMQQSKGLFGCEPNSWPLPGEVGVVR